MVGDKNLQDGRSQGRGFGEGCLTWPLVHVKKFGKTKKKKIKSKKESKKYFGSTVNVYGNVNKELKKRIELSRMRGRDGRYTW